MLYGGMPPHRPKLHRLYESEFPHLNYEIIDRFTKTYNCIAFTIGVTDRWVWDEIDFNRDGTSAYTEFVRFYDLHGYIPTMNEDEAVICVYGFINFGNVDVKHGSRKEGNWWYSKMGSGDLLRHKNMDVFRNSSYGEPLMMFKHK
tara:strand:+ start:922 stop:1356 length:435 start_codon:yes stop_codon:yes gene_type:complete